MTYLLIQGFPLGFIQNILLDNFISNKVSLLTDMFTLLRKNRGVFCQLLVLNLKLETSA